MSEILIPNFTGGSPVAVMAIAAADYGNLVMLIQHGGAMSFQHSMTPDQAREMAGALVALADRFIEVAA